MVSGSVSSTCETACKSLSSRLESLTVEQLQDLKLEVVRSPRGRQAASWPAGLTSQRPQRWSLAHILQDSCILICTQDRPTAVRSTNRVPQRLCGHCHASQKQRKQRIAQCTSSGTAHLHMETLRVLGDAFRQRRCLVQGTLGIVNKPKQRSRNDTKQSESGLPELFPKNHWKSRCFAAEARSHSRSLHHCESWNA